MSDRTKPKAGSNPAAGSGAGGSSPRPPALDAVTAAALERLVPDADPIRHLDHLRRAADLLAGRLADAGPCPITRAAACVLLKIAAAHALTAYQVLDDAARDRASAANGGG